MKLSILKSDVFNRNIWLISGFCFIIFTLIQFFAFRKRNIDVCIITLITTVLAFFYAYIYHRKLKNNKANKI